MLVYKKGQLKKELTPVKQGVVKYTLKHAKTGVKLSFDMYSDMTKTNKDVFATPKVYDSAINMVSPYLVSKEENGQYKIYESFWDVNKTLFDNFTDAITYFEESIFKELNEKPPQPPTQPDDSDPDKFKELPNIGDIVRIGKDRFGKVVDVNIETRNIDVAPMTKEEAMGILKQQLKVKTETSK